MCKWEYTRLLQQTYIFENICSRELSFCTQKSKSFNATVLTDSFQQMKFQRNVRFRVSIFISYLDAYEQTCSSLFSVSIFSNNVIFFSISPVFSLHSQNLSNRFQRWNCLQLYWRCCFYCLFFCCICSVFVPLIFLSRRAASFKDFVFFYCFARLLVEAHGLYHLRLSFLVAPDV